MKGRWWWVPWLLLVASPGAARAQERWAYPHAGERRNPLAPPPALYSSEIAPPLVVTSVMGKAGGPLHAVARFGVPLRERRVVRAGDRVGPYRVERVQADGVWVRLDVLGSARRIFVPRAGMRQADAASATPPGRD